MAPASEMGLVSRRSERLRLGDYPVKVFWGYASWNATQLLGEIARRGWGLVASRLKLGAFGQPWCL